MDLIAYGNLPHRALGKLSNMVPKIFKKSTKNGVPHRPRAPQTALGVSWGVLGAFWGYLGPSWMHLGAVLGDFGPNKWPTWLQLGCQNGAKMVQKSIQKSIKILMVFGIDF